MQPDPVLTIVAFLVPIAAGVAPMMWPQSRFIAAIIFWPSTLIAGVLLVWWVFSNQTLIIVSFDSMRPWIGWIFLFAALALGAVGLSLIAAGPVAKKETVPQAQTAAKEPTLQELITWETLTPAQLEEFKRAVNALPKRTVRIVCDHAYCKDLAIQLAQGLRDLEWSAHPWRQGARTENAITGFFVLPNDVEARAVGDALKAVTKMPVQLHSYLSERPKENAKDHGLQVSILAKPLPNSLPETVQREIKELGARIAALSEQISVFIGDRRRERQRLPVAGPMGPSWEDRQAFRRETETIFEERFGVRTAAQISELTALGIPQPFWVQTGGPATMGKFLGTIGDFLKEGRIHEARVNAHDLTFWQANAIHEF